MLILIKLIKVYLDRNRTIILTTQRVVLSQFQLLPTGDLMLYHKHRYAFVIMPTDGIKIQLQKNASAANQLMMTAQNAANPQLLGNVMNVGLTINT
jgi:hypothetical protein